MKRPARAPGVLAAIAVLMLLAAPSRAGDFSMTVESLKGRKFVQIALFTRDLPRAIQFYRDTLGMTFLFETNGMAFFDMGGQRLLIGQIRNEGERPGGAVVYFDAPDIDEIIPALEKRGVKFGPRTEVVQRTDTHELKLRDFRDPDGNALALMGMVPRK
ncbi:MAG: VOC family protein [Alphaproteobacteria bacterium]